MTFDQKHPLDILVVDDDRENLNQLKQLLPPVVRDHFVSWEFTEDFDLALEKLRIRRYDLLISDIYRDRESPHKNVTEGDIKVRDLVKELREHRFCPVVLFTDGQIPDNLVLHPFVLSIDKAAKDFVAEIENSICMLLDTGIPSVARKLHDELDKAGSSYIWGFLTDHWEDFNASQSDNNKPLERIVRRRAAVQLGRVDEMTDPPLEREKVQACDYYLYPPLNEELRLGSILRGRDGGAFRVVLTPHCFLTIQQKQQLPRAETVLTAGTILASGKINTTEWPNNQNRIDSALRKRTSLPSMDVGPPDGRYCFLPSFMEIPDMYCDLMAIESVPYNRIFDEYEQIAVLDTPFAEALQSSFGRLYGSVGLPVLDMDTIQHLLPPKKT